jgi:hypothetical protein
LIGDSGTGKSHPLIALSTEAAMHGFRVKYTPATKLVNELVEAADDKVLTKTIARSDMDTIPEDELWSPQVLHGLQGLYAWGLPPPPSFLEPDDLAALMTTHTPREIVNARPARPGARRAQPA